MKLQTTLHNYFKMHPVLRETEQWRRCSSHHPTFSIRRLYVSLFLWNHKEHIVWVLIIKWEYVVLLRSFVFIRCSWTSLVGVLIKSLLGSIPWRSLAWVPPPTSCLSLVPSVSLTCPLNFPPSPIPHQSSDRCFLFSPLKVKCWVHLQVCAFKLRFLMAKPCVRPAMNHYLLHYCAGGELVPFVLVAHADSLGCTLPFDSLFSLESKCLKKD